MRPKDQALEVWGEFACFTRPEMKVERFSYPVITPSAARGIYDAIFCKPNKDPSRAEFRWQITKVEVMNPPRYIALRRNEVKDKAPGLRTIEGWMSGKETGPRRCSGPTVREGRSARLWRSRTCDTDCTRRLGHGRASSIGSRAWRHSSEGAPPRASASINRRSVVASFQRILN
jgi:CRISPR-associated Cas5-like protein